MASTGSRALTLLSLLQARRDWPGTLLADRLGISPRTVRRDVDRLRALGYRITATRGIDGGYRLDAGSELPPLLFDDDQAIALAIALQVGPTMGPELDDGAQRALATVRQVMPPRLRQRMDDLRVERAPERGANRRNPSGEGAVDDRAVSDRADDDRAVRDGSVSDGAVDAATLVRLGRAVAEHEVIRFDYATPGVDANEGPPRRAEPHHLVHRRGRWYCIAWDLGRSDWRTFRIDRMALKTHGGGSFEPREVPGGDAGSFLTNRFAGLDESGSWPVTGSVVLALPATAIVPYADDADVEPLSGGGSDARCRVRIGSRSWTALAARIIGFDAPIAEVEPRELSDAFAVLANRIGAARGTADEGSRSRQDP